MSNYVEYKGKEVMIMTCSNCNIKCSHCYIGYKGNFEKEGLFNLCKELIKKHKIKLSGTELLLHPEFFDIIKFVKQDYILTNGIELKKHPEYIDVLKEIGIKYVELSYHFYIQNQISPIKLDDVIDVIHKVREKGLKGELRTTISTLNYKKCIDICNTAYDLGTDGIKFTNLISTGRASQYEEDYSLSDEQIDEFLSDLDTARSMYDKEEFCIRRGGTFGNGGNKKFYCPAVSNSVVITPELLVYPCIFLAKPGNEIGYVKNNKIYIKDDLKYNESDCLVKQICNEKETNTTL